MSDIQFHAMPDGRRIELLARREVVLCAGAIMTPQLLMLSGIGGRAELRKHGIDLASLLQLMKDDPKAENFAEIATHLIARKEKNDFGAALAELVDKAVPVHGRFPCHPAGVL